MPNKILTYYFYFSSCLGCLVYVLKRVSISLPTWVQNYCNDFLIIPIVLYLCLQTLRWSRGNTNYSLPLWSIVYIVLFFSFLFEYFLPKFKERYTADAIDILLYITGGLIFYLLQKK
ncbi:hypothetical protein BSU00_01840 [Tenacibaculum sp. SG-28]|nr:hypothetical protein BSU00_01840 [Tenacibaculum sp. SG-28]